MVFYLFILFNQNLFRRITVLNHFKIVILALANTQNVKKFLCRLKRNINTLFLDVNRPGILKPFELR